MTDLWSDFTQQPILAIQSGTCTNAITDSTRRIQQCVQGQMGHLDNRARALATSGNFEAALRDVARIRQLGPFSAVGYLCEGHVYSLQGRQKAAIAIYDQGLAAVPLSDPSRQLLVKARSMAQERDSTRIDFINKLPLDIITNIAPMILSRQSMTPSEIRQYLDVSRVWREKLLSCIRELDVMSTANDNHVDDKDLLGLIAPYCTTLTIDSKIPRLRQYISDARFPLLRTLNVIEEWDYADYNNNEDDERGSGHFFLDIIVSFRSTATLTHLMLFADESYHIPFADILSNCPSLVDLDISYIDSNMSTAPASCPNMKSLAFRLDEDQYFVMDDITKRFPGLEKLMVSPFHYTRALGIIQDNCPKLKVIGNHGIDDFPARSEYDDTSSAVGVRVLYVNSYITDWVDLDQGETEHMVEFMQRNSGTLEEVLFYAPFPYNGQQGDSHPAASADSNDFTFSRMTNFTQREICGPQHLHIPRLVAQKSPHLKKFELLRGDFNGDEGPVYVNVGELFDDLIGLYTLESAIVKLTSKDPTVDVGGIERFIQYHSRIDSQLHTLLLPQNVRLSSDALDSLAALPQLKTLGLGLPLMQGEGVEKVSRFIQKLGSGCPQLKRLELVSKGPIPDIIFSQLSKLNIKSLQLIMLSRAAPASLLSLLECPQLQELHIYPRCSKSDQNNIYIKKMLESKIPKLSW